MQTDKNRGAGKIGYDRALIQCDIHIAVSQHFRGNVTRLLLLSQPARQRQGKVLFWQVRRDARSGIAAAMCRIDDHQKSRRRRRTDRLYCRSKW